jgi:hypothetical protein
MMCDRPGSLSRCTQVRTKVHRKDLCWSIRLVYDPNELQDVTTTRPGVAEMLQMV